MIDQERREHLLLVVDNVIDVHTIWVESDTPHLTEELETAVDELVEVFEDGTIPGDCRDLTHRVAELSEHWHAWKAKVAASGGIATVPGDAFWAALEHVEDARRKAEPKPPIVLESIKELTDQKVPDRQICLIYGWIDGAGHPLLHKLHEERAKPGTHTGEGFLPPAEKSRRQKEARKQAVIDRIREKRRTKVESITTPAPEPIEDLVAQGVSAEQISRLKHMTIAQVMAACDELGVERPEESYGSLESYRAPYEKDLLDEAITTLEAGQKAVAERKSAESSPPSGPEAESLPSLDEAVEATSGAMTLEQEIIFYHQQEMAPADIAVAVSTEEEKITPQKVGKVIARFKREPEAFSMAGM